MEELTPACLGRMEIVSSWDWNSRTWSDWSPVLPPPQGQPYAVKCSRLSWLLLCYISMIMSCGLTQPVWFNCHNVNARQCNGVGVDRLLCCGWQCSVQSSRDDIIRPTTNTRLDSSHTLRQTSDYLLTNDWNNSATEKLLINSSSSPPSHHNHHPPTLTLLLILKASDIFLQVDLLNFMNPNLRSVWAFLAVLVWRTLQTTAEHHIFPPR